MQPQFIDFQQHGDERGQLVALEECRNVPFAIKRVYFMYNTLQGVHRGYHAHKELQQILFCVSGSCTIKLDDGDSSINVRLDKPYRGLFVGPGIWREMYDFTDDAVLMVLASEFYDENDYIRDYDNFLKNKRGK